MGHELVTRTVVVLLVPCLILYAVGCYSYQDVTLGEAEVSEPLLTGTKDGRYFQLVTWTADSLGNITGRGAEFRTLEDAKRMRSLQPFKGKIPADSITVLQADRLDTWMTVAVVSLLALSAGAVYGVLWLNSEFSGCAPKD